MDLSSLTTEARNPRTTDLDRMPVRDLLAAMNDEDATVSAAVRAALPQIAAAVDVIANSLRRGGRLIYVGAGTSGRLGLLDAVECPPTFGTEPEQVIALLAGEQHAVTGAVEDAEDSTELAIYAIDTAVVDDRDTVVGLAASGRTPYVIAALDRARERRAATVSVACNRDAECSRHAEIAIEVETGPEVLTGSTRLKAGTAQKLICNMLSTAAMVQLGKTFENLMIDVRPTNVKLADRARRVVAEAAHVDQAVAADALAAADGQVKVATVMLLANVDADSARQRLAGADQVVRDAVLNPNAPAI